MERITARDLQVIGAKLLDRVEKGESLVVTRRGYPVAVLGPYRGTAKEASAPVQGAQPDLTELVPGLKRASELPTRLGRCDFHGCTKRANRPFGDGQRCEDH